MIKLDTSTNSTWNGDFEAGLNRLMGRTEAPEALAPKASRVRTSKAKTPEQLKAAELRQRKAENAKGRKAIAAKIVEFLSSRARDLALAAIILGTFVAVFQGSLSSATLFGFTGASAIAFAIMPDALMVI